MAHIYGKVGESALQKSLEKREKVLWGILLVLMYGAMGMGVLIGFQFSKSLFVRYLAFATIVGVFIATYLCNSRQRADGCDRGVGLLAERRHNRASR